MKLWPWSRIRALEAECRAYAEAVERVTAQQNATFDLYEREQMRRSEELAAHEQAMRSAHADFEAHLATVDAELQRLRDERDAATYTADEAREQLRVVKADLATARAAQMAAEAVSDRALQQVERLTAALIEMKREGFETPRPVQQLEAQPGADLPPEVMSAIRDRAKPGSDLYRDLIAEAEGDIERGADPAELAKSILKGGSFSPWH